MWLTASEIAEMGLPGFPGSKMGVLKRAETEGWQDQALEWSDDAPTGVWRKRAAQGGGIEYHVTLLPSRARAEALRRLQQPGGPAQEVQQQRLSAADAWAYFERLPATRQEKAKSRLQVLQAVAALVQTGMDKGVAVQLTCGEQGVSRGSYYGWEGKIAGIPACDWLPYLADHYAGRQAEAEISDEAWELFKADFLRPEKPTAAECYRRLADANRVGQRGWVLPPQRSLMRRIEREIPAAVLVLRREGADALERLYPAQRRDRTVFQAGEALNYDGHKLDLRVSLALGGKTETVVRIFLMTFQDLRSGKITSWRLDLAETALGFRLAFLDHVEKYGVPAHVWSDNTMAAAAKENTAGSRYRRRFKIKPDDPIGLFAQLGCEVHFTRPAHGQSKPIERAFGDLSRYISKAPECAGAYMGNSPMTKPSNYGEKTIDFGTLEAVVAREIARFNSWSGRSGQTAEGRSYDEVWAEGYPAALDAGLVRMATAAQLRMWRLASEPVTCRQPDGRVELMGNRYWSEPLAALVGKKVVLRFDPDRLHQPLSVYRLDGSYLCDAPCIADVGFDSQEASKTHERARKGFVKAAKKLNDSLQVLGPAAVAAVQPALADAVLASESQIVRPVFGATALKPRLAEEALADRRDPALVFDFAAMSRGLQLRQAE